MGFSDIFIFLGICPPVSLKDGKYLFVHQLPLSTTTTTEGSKRKPLWVYRPTAAWRD